MCVYLDLLCRLSVTQNKSLRASLFYFCIRNLYYSLFADRSFASYDLYLYLYLEPLIDRTANLSSLLVTNVLASEEKIIIYFAQASAQHTWKKQFLLYYLEKKIKSSFTQSADFRGFHAINVLSSQQVRGHFVELALKYYVQVYLFMCIFIHFFHSNLWTVYVSPIWRNWHVLSLSHAIYLFNHLFICSFFRDLTLTKNYHKVGTPGNRQAEFH